MSRRTPIYGPDNHGQAQVRSLEPEVKLPVRPVELRFNVGRNWSRVLELPGPHNRLDRQPTWTGSLGVDYVRGPFRAGASFAYASGGWWRTAARQRDHGSSRRDLETYCLFKVGSSGQLRVSAVNLLAPDQVWGLDFDDQGLRRQETRRTGTYRGWHVRYEHKW